MDDNNLGSVLSDQPAAEVVEQTTQEEVVDTGEQVTAPPAEPQEDPVEKHRKGLEAAVMAERRKRQELEQRIAQFEQQQRPPQPKAGLERPKRDAFASLEEYEDALLEYGDRRRDAREQETRQQEQQRLHEETMRRTADEVVKKGQQKYADFDTVINSGLGSYLTPVMHQALLESDQAHELAYWLGKNPAEAARVSALPPPRLLIELGRIESKLSAAPAQPKPSIPQTLTQARDSRGQFQKEPAYDGPTPLDDVLATRR
jgi:hypothetical protein